MTIKFGFHENPILNPDLNNKFKCKNDALKIIRELPKWKPATKNGIPISSYFCLVIDYDLSYYYSMLR